MKTLPAALLLPLVLAACQSSAPRPDARAAALVSLDGTPCAAGNPVGADGRIREFKAPALRLMRTQAKAPRGTVLVFPGGGYGILAVEKEGLPTGAFLNAQGFDAAILEYPVAPGGGAAVRDRALADARTAWELLRQGAGNLGLNRGRLDLMGFSAGGHLAARLAQSLPEGAQPDDLVLVYPAYLDERKQETPIAPPAAPRRLFIATAKNDHGPWLLGAQLFAKAWGASGRTADLRPLATPHGSGQTDELSAAVGAFLNGSTLAPVPKLEEGGYDWLGRHEAVVREQKALDPDLVFIGDSITHAWGGVPKAGLGANWHVGEAAAAKAFAGHRVLNCGFGWDRTQNVLWRLDHGELDGLRPKTVVIHIGTNNLTPTKNAGPCTPEEIAQGVLAVCGCVRAKCPGTKIMLMAVFPRWTPAHPGRATIARVNQLLADAVKLRQAQGEKIVLRDLGPDMLQPDGTFKPGVMAGDLTHLVAGDYEIWAKAVKAELE